VNNSLSTFATPPNDGKPMALTHNTRLYDYCLPATRIGAVQKSVPKITFLPGKMQELAET
jgi:hypothetical protein